MNVMMRDLKRLGYSKRQVKETINGLVEKGYLTRKVEIKGFLGLTNKTVALVNSTLMVKEGLYYLDEKGFLKKRSKEE